MKKTVNKKLALSRLTTHSLGLVSGGDPSLTYSAYCPNTTQCPTNNCPPPTQVTFCITYCDGYTARCTNP